MESVCASMCMGTSSSHSVFGEQSQFHNELGGESLTRSWAFMTHKHGRTRRRHSHTFNALWAHFRKSARYIDGTDGRKSKREMEGINNATLKEIKGCGVKSRDGRESYRCRWSQHCPGEFVCVCLCMASNVGFGLKTILKKDKEKKNILYNSSCTPLSSVRLSVLSVCVWQRHTDIPHNTEILSSVKFSQNATHFANALSTLKCLWNMDETFWKMAMGDKRLKKRHVGGYNEGLVKTMWRWTRLYNDVISRKPGKWLLTGLAETFDIQQTDGTE